MAAGPVTGREAGLSPATRGPSVEGYLADVGARLIGMLDLERAARLIAELAVGPLGDVALLVLPTTRGRWEWWRQERGRPVEHGRVRKVPVEFASTLARAVTSTAGIATAELPQAEIKALPQAFAGSLARCARLSVVSLAEDEHGIPGALVFGRLKDEAVFGDRQADASTAFAQRAASTLAGALKHERWKDAAYGLQSTLRPPELPHVTGTEMAVWYEPGDGPLGVGGDFYDVHPRSDGSAMFVLGDVCGNGAAAAALTGRVRHALAALQLVERSGDRLLSLLNQTMLNAGSSRFATLIVGSIMEHAGGVRLTIATGGHPPPLVLRHTGEVEEPVLAGMLVGISPQAKFAECTVDLAEGDLCLLYTDGITEARGFADRTELYGAERLRKALSGCGGEDAPAAVDEVRRSVQQWLGDADHDDIALLAIQCVTGK
ncbi:Stage II sporulation protein E (SpoIIE) [Amycolatopsis xylanica]|uniref:Stage II sporulation protein E (SpoIIE) n=1 Tax=Amycolatopsis xylanica TaxID=589385 RepID=A0A1H3G0K7_9PSEU|nr:Stage II sporulation protein E (SpoIIE) [Amycolatopsis xylanica]